MTEDVLRQVGVGHVKGVLFHGPPGNGKTLLARTIGKILGSSQVMKNSWVTLLYTTTLPFRWRCWMVLKSSASFLESQRGIWGVMCIVYHGHYIGCIARGHFEAARKAWEEYGDNSEMFVIIIDEIDAICKPRGTHQWCHTSANCGSVSDVLLWFLFVFCLMYGLSGLWPFCSCIYCITGVANFTIKME